MSTSFSNMQAMARSYAETCISQAFAYEKRRWDKTHKDRKFKVAYHVLLSTVYFDNLMVNHKLKDPFIGPFTVLILVGTNTLKLDLHSAYARRHLVSVVSLVKLWEDSDMVILPQRASKETPLPEIEEERGTSNKVIQQSGKGSKKERQFLVTFKGMSADSARWVTEKEIPNAGILLQSLRLKERSEVKKMTQTFFFWASVRQDII